MEVNTVGIADFRDHISDYLQSKATVTITQDGEAIGFYVPLKPRPSAALLEELRIAGERMQELIAAAGTSEDELMADLKALRAAERAAKA